MALDPRYFDDCKRQLDAIIKRSLKPKPKPTKEGSDAKAGRYLA